MILPQKFMFSKHQNKVMLAIVTWTSGSQCMTPHQKDKTLNQLADFMMDFSDKAFSTETRIERGIGILSQNRSHISLQGRKDIITLFSLNQNVYIKKCLKIKTSVLFYQRLVKTILLARQLSLGPSKRCTTSEDIMLLLNYRGL